MRDSTGRLAAAGADRPRLPLKLARRAALIFPIGFLLNFLPYFNVEKVRIPGVLQRIALCSLLAGLLCLCLGVIFDTILMPINKSLWTPSYCFLMTGWTLPFVIYGMNALFIFALSGFLAKMFGYIKFAQPDGSLRSLAVAWCMWRKKWFVKVLH